MVCKRVISMSLFSHTKFREMENNGRPSMCHTLNYANVQYAGFFCAHTQNTVNVSDSSSIYANIYTSVWERDQRPVVLIVRWNNARYTTDTLLKSLESPTSPAKSLFRLYCLLLLVLLVYVSPFSSVVLIHLLRLLLFHIISNYYYYFK